MKDKHSKRGPRLSPALVEDKPAERLKKRLQDSGIIINAGAGKAAKLKGRRKAERSNDEQRTVN